MWAGCVRQLLQPSTSRSLQGTEPSEVQPRGGALSLQEELSQERGKFTPLSLLAVWGSMQLDSIHAYPLKPLGATLSHIAISSSQCKHLIEEQCTGLPVTGLH